jgi:hypothetical protein
MRKLYGMLVAALLALFAVGTVSAADCRGNNQFNGGHDGPPKHQQNVCTK